MNGPDFSTDQPMMGPPPPLHCGSCGGQFGLCCAGGALGTVKVKVGLGFGVDGAGGSAVGDGLGCSRLGCGLWLVGVGRVVGGWVVEG